MNKFTIQFFFYLLIDLYSKWVAQVLRVILFVETWLHDSRLPSDCSTKFE